MIARATWISIVLALLAACGSDDSTGSNAASGGAGGSSGSGSSGSSGSVASCREADLSKCDYPERNLKITERDGITIPDSTGTRNITVLARIPEGAGPFPVVVWSHGGGFNAQGQRLGNEWGAAIARQGYVALNVGHPPLTPEAGKALCAAGKVPAAECSPTAFEDEDTALVGILKELDLIAVVDKLGTLSQESVARGGPAIDLAKVAAAGWSAGARGPLLMLGTKLETTPSAPLYERPDARIIAAVALSPAGPGFGGYYDNGAETSWTNLRGPLLMATGQNDVKEKKTELTGPIRRFGFTAQPGDGSRRLLYSNLAVGVGGHDTYNLGDANSSDQRLARLSRALRSSLLAFLDANVKGDTTAKDWLATNNAKVLAGDADWEQR